jgi:hypothetical protein
MATTTPNYGWDVPTSTDYVKDGATAIETLGDDIDASLFSITNGKNVGLSFISAQTVSAAGTITFSNVYSSTFQDYLITISGVSSALVQMQYRNATSGTPTTGNTYEGAELYANNGVSPSNYAGGASDRQHCFDSGTLSGTGTLYVFDPFLAAPTRLQWHTFGYSSTTSFQNTQGNTRHSASTSYDGFVISVTGGTFTGDIRVYGLRTS